ncbi:MAG TPA: c-type cytochrome [Burkholderiales bacterium]|nr:c-type cytochrome [Burkholderiales bacterium]
MKEGLLAVCLACHGASGVSETPLTPSLGAQPAFYVVAQLFLFRGGRRDNEVMTAQAKDLKDEDLRSLSDAIAKLPPPPPPKEGRDAERFERGRKATEGRHCTSCHGADWSGNKNVPRVANQREDYLFKALKDYRTGKRIGYGNAQMPETVAGMDDKVLGDIAHYLAHFRGK